MSARDDTGLERIYVWIYSIRVERKSKPPFRIYFWLVPNPTTGRLRKTRYRMPEWEALRYPGAIKVEEDSTLVEREPRIDPGKLQ